MLTTQDCLSSSGGAPPISAQLAALIDRFRALSASDAKLAGLLEQELNG